MLITGPACRRRRERNDDSNGNPTAEKWTLPSPSGRSQSPTVYHWFHLCCQINYASNQLGSIKKPFEKYRLWINTHMPTNGYYTGSLIAPRYVGRVLDDSSSQVYQATYNAPSVIPTPGVAYGNLLSKTDPAGRATLYNYASTIRPAYGAAADDVALDLYDD